MKHIPLIILILFTVIFSQAKPRIVASIKGDLDGDSIPEVVRIVDYPDSTDFTRFLQIYTQVDSNLILWLSTTGGMRSNSGGFGTDAFSGLEIENFEIIVYFEGGTRQHWGTVQHYGLVDGQFLLRESYNSGGTVDEDSSYFECDSIDLRAGKWFKRIDNNGIIEIDSGTYAVTPIIELDDCMPLADELWISNDGASDNSTTELDPACYE